LSGLWHKYYGELKAFIQDHAGVIIQENLITIDEDVRPLFYKQFNKVRSAFLGENFSEWLDESGFLATKYLKIEAYLLEELRLEEILMPVELQRFLNDPMQQVIRDLFDPLFELLQEKIEPEEFEERADQEVRESFKTLYQKGYIKWFVLSLIKNIDPEKAYEVPLPQPTSKQIIKHRDDIRQGIPFPQETRLLSFEVGRRDILLIPDFIIRSAALEKYVAFRTEIGKAMWRATYYSERREWFSIEDMVEKYGIAELKPDLLLYIDENLEDVSLVADSEKICRPDVIVFFLDQLEETGDSSVRKMEKIRLAHEMLRPVRGTRVIAKHHVPESMLKELNEDIKVIHFGFDNLKWEILLTVFQTPYCAATKNASHIHGSGGANACHSIS